MKKMIVSAIFLMLLASCEDNIDYNVEVKFDQTTFIDQRQQWNASNIKNYKYQLLGYGYLGHNGIVTVKDGVFKEYLPANDYNDINNFMDYSTIDNIYGKIEEIYKSTNNTKHSKSEDYLEEIYVEYDKTNHIPVKIDYKYYVPDNIAADGTFYYEIKSFEIIETTKE